MINHRIATEVACKKLFESRDFNEFTVSLENFSNQLKNMAGQAQYTMIAHALDAFDESFRKAKNLDNDRIIATARLIPLSLAAVLVALEHVDAGGANELAKNIVKHETFPEESDVYINEVMQKFCTNGFASLTPMILERLFRIPFGDEDFDYVGFADTLYDAFSENCKNTIDWAVAFESELMETGFSERLAGYTRQEMGNLFYKKGLKHLGAMIMEIHDRGCRGLELHERDAFLGLRVDPKHNHIYDREALASYLLGSTFIEPEWFDVHVDGLTSKVINLSATIMRATEAMVVRDNLEKVYAIAISNCSKVDSIKSLIKGMSELNLTLSSDVADFALNKALKYFVKKPQDIVDIMKLQEPLGAELNFEVYAKEIGDSVNSWSGTHSLAIGDILSCHYGSSNGFPCNIQHIATAVDENWRFWNDKEQQIALNQLPFEVVKLSKNLKALKISNELGI